MASKTLFDYRTWLGTAVCRDASYTASPSNIQVDGNDVPIAITGTINIPAVPAIPAEAPNPSNPAGSPAVAAQAAQANVPMTWQMNGQAMTRNRAMDLVQVIPLTSITDPNATPST